MLQQVLFTFTGAERIGQGLPHQPLQQPTLIDAIAGPFNRSAADSQVQGAAGTKQAIQHSGGFEAGIEQHGSPQGNTGAIERPLIRQISCTLKHRQEIAVAGRGIRPPRQMTPGIRAAHVQTQHRVASCLQTQSQSTQTFPTTGSPQTMQQDHQSLGLSR